MYKRQMKFSAQSHASIASSLREAVDKYIADGERTVVTDIHLQPKQDSGGELQWNTSKFWQKFFKVLSSCCPLGSVW